MLVNIIIPFISSLIGYATNKIALKFLFRPRKPILGIQGALPKHRERMSEAIGKTIKDYILNEEEVKDSINHEDIEHVVLLFVAKIKNPVLTMVLKNYSNVLVVLLENYVKNNMKDILRIVQFDKIVTTKFKTTKFEVLEQILNEGLGCSFKFIEISGAVLGFIIGLLQVVLINFLQ